MVSRFHGLLASLEKMKTLSFMVSKNQEKLVSKRNTLFLLFHEFSLFPRERRREPCLQLFSLSHVHRSFPLFQHVAVFVFCVYCPKIAYENYPSHHLLTPPKNAGILTAGPPVLFLSVCPSCILSALDPEEKSCHLSSRRLKMKRNLF